MPETIILAVDYWLVGGGCWVLGIGGITFLSTLQIVH